jgi:hypothetical protein
MPRPKLDKKMRSVSATVGEPIYARLVALSRAEDTSMARIIRRALGEFLANPSIALDVVEMPRRGSRR